MVDDSQSEYISLADMEGVVAADQYYSEPEVLESIFKIPTPPLPDDVKQDIKNSCAKRGDPAPSLESLTPTVMTPSGIITHLVDAGLPYVYNHQAMAFNKESIRVFFLEHDIALPWQLFPSSPSNSKRKTIQLLDQRELKAYLLEKRRARQRERDEQDERELRRLQLEKARARAVAVPTTEVQKESPAIPNAKHQPGGPTTKKLLEVASELLRSGRLSDGERRQILAFQYKEKKLLTWDRAYKDLPGVGNLSRHKKTQERNFYTWAKKGEKICRDVYQHGILTPLRAKSASKIDPLGSPLRCLGSPEAQGVSRGDADSGDDQKNPAGGATRWKIH